MVGLPSNSADPFFSDRNLGNSGPSSGSIRNFFSIFFNRLEVSQVFFQSAARPIGHKKNVCVIGQTISRPERDERTVLQAHADAAAAHPIIGQLGAIIKCRFPALQVLNTVDSNLHA